MANVTMAEGGVVFHLGVPKTGTTSIQKHLNANADILSPHLTVFTPKPGSELNRLVKSAVFYSLNPSAKAEQSLISEIKGFKDFVAAFEGPCLISHETLIGASPGRKHERGLFPAAAHIIGLIDQHFAAHKPRYIVYTRDIASWKRSVHAQAIKSDQYKAPLNTFLTETQAITGWDDFQDRLTAVLGDRISFFEMETSLSEYAPAEALLRQIGVAPDLIAALRPAETRQNIQPLPSALEFIRHLNTVKMSHENRKRIVKIVKQNQSLFSSTFSRGPAEE